MKKQRDFMAYLDDINEAVTKGLSFIKDITFDEFQEDEKLNLHWLELLK